MEEDIKDAWNNFFHDIRGRSLGIHRIILIFE